jgi:ADP-ribose pyrophosphatase YjhB (NUDIX family)
LNKLREVAEESGLTKVKIIQLLGSYDRYVEKAQEFKTIHYYLMHQTEQEDPRYDDPQFEMKWHELDRLPTFHIQEQEDVIKKHKDLIVHSLS